MAKVKEGYGYTYICSWNKEEAKARALEIRNKGFKAYVETSVSKGRIYNRPRYQIYAEIAYFEFRVYESRKESLKCIPSKLENLKNNYEAQVTEVKEEEEELKKLIQDYESTHSKIVKE